MVNVKSVQEIIDYLNNTESVYETIDSLNKEHSNLMHLNLINALFDILENFNNSSSREVIDKNIENHLNKMFILGYGIGIKDHNNNKDCSNEVVKNLAGEELYKYIDETKVLTSILTYDKLSSKKRGELTQHKLNEEIVKITSFYLKRIFVAGYMTGSMKNNIKNDENKALGMLI